MLLLKTAVPLAQAAVTGIHHYRRFIACVLLSVLLHALVLVAYQGQTSIGLRPFESRHAPPLEVTLRPLSSARGPSDEKSTPTENAPAGVELSRLRGSSSNPADAAAQVKTRPNATGDESAPHIDLEAARRMAREIERERKALAAQESQALAKSGLEYDTPLGRSIEKAARADCRVDHAGMGLLAVFFLVKDAITDRGCRW